MFRSAPGPVASRSRWSPKAVLRRLLGSGLTTILALGWCFQPGIAGTVPLVFTETEGVVVYYPPTESAIAYRMIGQLPEMLSFLTARGLPVKTPLHVVLDPDLDQPVDRVHMIPHREIRIPLRAPGVFEEGYLEADPWTYFLFRGLCAQGIYGLRSGIPGLLHKGFGEIVSPNIVLPDWLLDGTGHLLYTEYRRQPASAPLDTAIFDCAALPDLDDVSNHPSQWPGHYAYRIYGRPFIRWLYQRFGWDALLDFYARHGRGIIPIEIDTKSRDSFAASWPVLWRQFIADIGPHEFLPGGAPMIGASFDPDVYWNRAGVFPGVERIRARSRFGTVDGDGYLWLSEYDDQGISKLARYKGDQLLTLDNRHVWDPGVGAVAVTRSGHRPQLLLYASDTRISLSGAFELDEAAIRAISAPPGVIQLSGPVRAPDGRIAVAGNRGGNWDIWLFDGDWERIGDSPAVETDPWFHNGELIFASNAGGRFQIVDRQWRPISQCTTAALMPRGDRYLCLATNGWRRDRLVEPAAATSTAGSTAPASGDFKSAAVVTNGLTTANEGPDEGETGSPPRPAGDPGADLAAQPYSPWQSIWPNYLQPDLFVSGSDIQLGVGMQSWDVSRDYRLNGAVRYGFDQDYMSLRLGGSIKNVGLQYTRYPVGYTTALGSRVDESRNEFRMFWRPFFPDTTALSMNYRAYRERDRSTPTQHEFWGGFHFGQRYGRHAAWVDLEVFTDGSQSLFGGGELLFGKTVYASFRLQAGKTWGQLKLGHNTYRLGGDVGEGFFTRRPSRLFALRGFPSNVLEAGQAVTAGTELFIPLADLQAGYKTMPLFFHRILLGTFVDAGAAGEPISGHDILVGGGFELVTQMELAWGVFSSLSVGVGWPLRQPDYLDEAGPRFLVQIGRPL